MGSRYTLGSKNRRATMLEPKITNSMTQQLLVIIPQFSPFAFTMILMISDMASGFGYSPTPPADYNLDGSVNISDVVLLLQEILSN